MQKTCSQSTCIIKSGGDSSSARWKLRKVLQLPVSNPLASDVQSFLRTNGKLFYSTMRSHSTPRTQQMCHVGTSSCLGQKFCAVMAPPLNRSNNSPTPAAAAFSLCPANNAARARRQPPSPMLTAITPPCRRRHAVRRRWLSALLPALEQRRGERAALLECAQSRLTAGRLHVRACDTSVAVSGPRDYDTVPTACCGTGSV